MSREYPRFPIPGVAAVTINNGKILLAVRGKPPSMGKWGIPGGIVELGEKVEDAVIREVFEETNVVIKPIKLITVLNSIVHDDEGKIRTHYVLLEYLCEYVSGEVHAASDAPDAKWISFEKLDSIDMMESTRKFVKQVAKQEGYI
ncbi:NUDIX hydrolase [Candidatus Bathyarchaeota archaeon]|nr:NUDIX hydrolase [Candidatus Bathyarchaeota archaeon]